MTHLTGWDDAEMRRGQASADAQAMQAAAVCRYFLSEASGRFGELLVVFEKVKFTGLTQTLGQLTVSSRDYQSNCWVN
jgi:hypothetical protein